MGSLDAKIEEWPTNARDAIAIQKRLAHRVRREDEFAELKCIAGIDAAFPQGGRRTRAAIVIMDVADGEIVETQCVEQDTRFPYVPGLLSFRELPAMLAALAKCSRRPDMILCDGQGYAHPRRFGSACHLGVLTDIPSIGVGKSRLCGAHANVPTPRGRWRSLKHRDETIGVVLRTRANVAPLYVSCGHRVSLASARRIVLRWAHQYRLPEPIRAADRLAGSD